LLSLSFGEFLYVYGAEHYGKWNCVVTSFFVDTASCVLDHVERISLLLCQGGVWINFGPLPYYYAGQESAKPTRKPVELTYHELKEALPSFGFQIEQERSRIECQYCQDPHSLKHRYYDAAFFVAVKS